MATRKKPSATVNKDQDRALQALILAVESFAWALRSVNPEASNKGFAMARDARVSLDFAETSLPERD